MMKERCEGKQGETQSEKDNHNNLNIPNYYVLVVTSQQ